MIGYLDTSQGFYFLKQRNVRKACMYAPHEGLLDQPIGQEDGSL